MVVIAKASADRMDAGASEPAVISSALAGKFSDPSQYASDLKGLEDALDAARVNYQVFTTAGTVGNKPSLV